MRTYQSGVHHDTKLQFFIPMSILLFFCLSCSDADRVNFSTVADLKDPLIAKVHYLQQYRGEKRG